MIVDDDDDPDAISYHQDGIGRLRWLLFNQLLEYLWTSPYSQWLSCLSCHSLRWWSMQNLDSIN